MKNEKITRNSIKLIYIRLTKLQIDQDFKLQKSGIFFIFIKF